MPLLLLHKTLKKFDQDLFKEKLVGVIPLSEQAATLQFGLLTNLLVLFPENNKQEDQYKIVSNVKNIKKMNFYYIKQDDSKIQSR